MYDKKKELSNSFIEVPKWDDVCHVAGCEKETDIALMKVFNKSKGRNEIGSFRGQDRPKKSPYGFVKDNKISMYDQYDFISWVCRC